MACGSGCCGPPQNAEQAASSSNPAPPTTANCDDDVDSCCASDATSDRGCQDSCCGGGDAPIVDKNPSPAPAGCQSDCCGSEVATTSKANSLPKHDGQESDAPRPAQKGVDTVNPDCCDGTKAPCCDDSCLDRLALRACESEKLPREVVKEKEAPFGYGSSVSLNKSTECLGVEDDKPCGYHTRVTRDRWASRLAALDCICRALLALGQESCCTPKQLSSVDRKHSFKRSSSRSSRPSIMTGHSSDSCCKPGTPDSHEQRHSRKLPPHRSHKHAHHDGQGRSHGSGTRVKVKEISCCDFAVKGGGTRAEGGSCADSCCGDGQEDDIRPVSEDLGLGADVEKGHADYEHIVLSVSGMTCTGCATKMQKTLAALQQVRNAKAIMVLSRAEFDLDARFGTLKEVMDHLERASEFKCELMKLEEFGFDATVPDAAAFKDEPIPSGVTDITILDKKTVHITYDPAVSQARDLVEKGWGSPLKLAEPRPDPSLAANNKHVRSMGYTTLLSIVLTLPVLVMAWAPLPDNEIAYGAASLALATIVQIVVAGPFYVNSLKSLVFSRMVEMDLLIVLSTSAAYVFSVISFAYLAAGQPLSTGEFFETSTLLVTLIMLGRYVAALARQKAVESISIRSLQASTATIVEKDGNTRDIDTRLLQYGDIFKVAPDSTIPTDGTVIEGISEVNESMITGESQPVKKRVKSHVIAGTINGSGTLVVRLSRLPGRNTISTIAELVDKAKASQPRIQLLADKVASYFVPLILTLMVITFAAWIGTGITSRGLSASEAAIEAVTYAITVLIVSCPCAIGLAVPMVIVIAIGVAAKNGVVFKESSVIEIAHKTSHVVFDKTGTLTEGRLSVTSEQHSHQSDAKAAMGLLLGLVKDIKHPVSVAIAAHLKSKGISPASVSEIKALPGKGVEGRSASGSILRAGNSRWLGVGQNDTVQQVLGQSLTAFCFTIDNEVAVVYGLRDTVRSDSLVTIQQLQSRGIAVHLVSGDDEATVSALAAHLMIPESNVRGRCSPADKQKYILALRGMDDSQRTTAAKPKKDKSPVVIFCGDGTNDAAALAQATIGVAIQHADDKGIGADVAKSAAHVILATPRLGGILTLINVGKKSVTRIWLNFAWSFIYNIFAILLGAGAFSSLNNVRIPPEYAGLGEIVSVLPVIAMAVQLRWEKV